MWRLRAEGFQVSGLRLGILRTFSAQHLNVQWLSPGILYDSALESRVVAMRRFLRLTRNPRP